MYAAAGGFGLLERAIGYALAAVDTITPQALSRPTPCAGWDLRMLIDHVNDSLDTLREGVESGCVGASRPVAETVPDPVTMLRYRAGRLLGAWPRHDSRPILIAGRPMPAWIVAATGAIEIAVHGWDIAQAGDSAKPIPGELAMDLLEICPLVVTDDTRYQVFAAPVAVPPRACPGDQLVALLGRTP
jgi:uncharacterized protein (TIGR03086 family)